MLGLVVLTQSAWLQPAEATGTAVCTISGTITFTHSGFAGSGTYQAFPPGTGTCLHSVASGTVEYGFPTTAYDIRLVEPHSYALAAAGVFTTPSLKGTFQVSPPCDGDCVTKPVPTALFVAQASLLRFYPPDPDRYIPEKPRLL